MFGIVIHGSRRTVSYNAMASTGMVFCDYFVCFAFQVLGVYWFHNIVTYVSMQGLGTYPFFLVNFFLRKKN